MKDSIITDSLSVEDCKAIMHAAFFTPLSSTFSQNGGRMLGIPMIADGPPGGGKSSFWYWFAKTWLVRTFRGKEYTAYASITIGAQGEGRFGVIPVPTTDPETGRMTLMFPPPDDLMRAFPEGVGLVVWDDLSAMPPALSPVALDGIQMRRIGTTYLGDGVRCMGATNAIGDAAGGWTVPPAVINRSGWLPWRGYDSTQFGRFLMNMANEKPIERRSLEEEEMRVDRHFADALTKASRLTAGFLFANPTRQRTKPKAPGEGRAVAPFASERSWDLATRAYASSMVHNLTSTQTLAWMGSLLGDDIAVELDGYVRNADLPNVTAVLDGTETFEHKRTRLDRTHVFMESAVQVLVSSDTNRAARLRRFGEIALPLVDEAADILEPAMKALWNARLRDEVINKVVARMDVMVSAGR